MSRCAWDIPSLRLLSQHPVRFSICPGFLIFNEVLLLMVALKKAGMGLVDLYFVHPVSAMVSSSSV
jgi:hypothetical protein